MSQPPGDADNPFVVTRSEEAPAPIVAASIGLVVAVALLVIVVLIRCVYVVQLDAILVGLDDAPPEPSERMASHMLALALANLVVAALHAVAFVMLRQRRRAVRTGLIVLALVDVALAILVGLDLATCVAGVLAIAAAVCVRLPGAGRWF